MANHPQRPHIARTPSVRSALRWDVMTVGAPSPTVRALCAARARRARVRHRRSVWTLTRTRCRQRIWHSSDDRPRVCAVLIAGYDQLFCVERTFRECHDDRGCPGRKYVSRACGGDSGRPIARPRNHGGAIELFGQRHERGIGKSIGGSAYPGTMAPPDPREFITAGRGRPEPWMTCSTGCRKRPSRTRLQRAFAALRTPRAGG